MHPSLVIVHPGIYGQQVIGGVALRRGWKRTHTDRVVDRQGSPPPGACNGSCGCPAVDARMPGHSSVAFLHYHADTASGGLLVRLGFMAKGAVPSPKNAMSGQQAATQYEIDLAAGREARAA